MRVCDMILIYHHPPRLSRQICRTHLNRRLFTQTTIAMGISNYASPDGEFRRKDSSFRNWISSSGPFPPEKDRYHLFVSWACPWGTVPERQL
jgi:glutathionyl-hydroquinone reductase